MKLRVRTLLLGLIPLAVAFAAARHILFIYINLFGPQIYLLSIGERVVLTSNIRQPLRIATLDGEVSLDSGTEAVVTRESTWDEDSCYPDREIDVVIDGGPHAGLTARLRRGALRERSSWGLLEFLVPRGRGGYDGFAVGRVEPGTARE